MVFLIRAEQIEALDRGREADFARRYLPFFRELWSEEASEYSDSQLFDILLAFVREARGFGVTGDRLIMRYASFQFAFDGKLTDPAEFPGPAAVLHDLAFNGRRKIDLLAMWISLNE